jgi:ribonuclease P protein component
MLPASSRLRLRSEFDAAVRGGRRAGGPHLVVHLLTSTGSAVAGAADVDTPPRAGFVVGRTVGPAVARSRVRRRLRHVVRDRLPSLPPGAAVVVRALPGAAGRSSAELGAEFDRALERARHRTPRRSGALR